MRDIHNNSHKNTLKRQIDDEQRISDTANKPLTRAQSQQLKMAKSTSYNDNKKHEESQTRPQQRQQQHQRKERGVTTTMKKSSPVNKRAIKRRRLDEYNTDEDEIEDKNDDNVSAVPQTITSSKTTRPVATQKSRRAKEVKDYREVMTSNDEDEGVFKSKRKRCSNKKQQHQQSREKVDGNISAAAPVPKMTSKLCASSRSVRAKKVKSHYEPSLPQDEEEENKEPSNIITFPFPPKILPSELVFQDNKDTNLGEGRVGQVVTAKYGQVLVACKTRRTKQPRIQFEQRLARELEFAGILSVCRSMNPYIGVMTCKRSELVYDPPRRNITAKDEMEHYAIQRYYKHGDLLGYVHNKNGGRLHPIEVLQIAIHLFSAITDAHNLGIGLVDIKRENVLIDTGGSAVLTDFGSCVKMNGADKIDLNDTEDGVCWTDEVAAPEMIGKREFFLTSDVFMTTLIVGELLMSPMSSEVFQKEFLQRKQKFGSVDLQVNMVPPPFRAFCPLLKQGLINDPLERLTASKGLEFLEHMYHASFDMKLRETYLFSRSSSSSSSSSTLTTITNNDHTIISTATTSRIFKKHDTQGAAQKQLIQEDTDDPFYIPLSEQEQGDIQDKYDPSDALMRDGSLISSCKETQDLALSSGDERDLDCHELRIPDADDDSIHDEDITSALHIDSTYRPVGQEGSEYQEEEEMMRDDISSNSSSNEDSDINDKFDYIQDNQNEKSTTESYIMAEMNGSEEPENDQVQVLNNMNHTVPRSTVSRENRNLNRGSSFSTHFPRKRLLQVYVSKTTKRKLDK